MIAQFKPASRLVTMASVTLLAALGCLTFTRAAENSAAPKPAAKSEQETAARQDREAHQQTLNALEKKSKEIEMRLQQKAAELGKLRDVLKIPDAETAANWGPPEVSNLQHYERLRVEAQADYHQYNTLYTSLTNLSRGKLRRAVLTVSPDLTQGGYLEQLASQEQKLADLQATYSDEHPDVLKVKAVIKKINTQIDERVEGIIEGWRIKVAAQKAKLDGLQAEVDKAKQADIKAATERSSYDQAKRDLETLQQMRERLQMRMLEEEINAALPKPGGR